MALVRVTQEDIDSIVAAVNTRAKTTDVDNALAGIVGLVEASHIGRADKYLSQQAVANMIYTDNKLTKVRYNNDTDVEYESLTYDANGKLTNVAHYVASELAGNTALSYTNGKLVSAIYTAV